MIAWVDASNGVAGDMLLGALLDAGASLDTVKRAIEAVMPTTVRLRVSEVRRAGMRATKLDVDVIAPDLPHRDYAVIVRLLDDAPLDADVRTRAQAVFRALAEAEARAHGIEIGRVHFHEVGAWDSIADIVGCCAALASLGIDGLRVGPIALGSGTITTAHGAIPIPVPAVLELSRGWTVTGGGSGELATPTGMALLTALGTPTPSLPAGIVRQVGLGAGTRDDPHRPNVVRVVLTEPSAQGAPGASVIECNVDDLDPRVWPSVLDALLAAGASDAWLTPILMKKGRPAHTLSALVPSAKADAVRDAIYAHVPTLGMREHPVAKHELDRTWREVSVAGHGVRIKLGRRGSTIVTATPEFVDVVAAAEASGRPVGDVLAAAVAAAGAAGLAVGERL